MGPYHPTCRVQHLHWSQPRLVCCWCVGLSSLRCPMTATTSHSQPHPPACLARIKPLQQSFRARMALPTRFPCYTMLPAALSGTDAPMLITTFPKPSSIKRLNPGQADGTIQTITDQIDWPNEVHIQNSTMFGAEAMIVGAGFLVP